MIILSVNKIIGWILAYCLIAIVIEKKSFSWRNISSCNKKHPANTFIAKLNSPYIFFHLRVLLGIINPWNKDGDIGELARRDVQALNGSGVPQKSKYVLIMQLI